MMPINRIADISKKDAAYFKAMDEIRELIEAPEAMKDWFESKKKAFDALPED